jgi:hypothetical protein
MDTFRRDVQLPALGDLYGICRFVSRGSLRALNFFDHVKTFQDFAEDDMASVKPRCYHSCDEKLGAWKSSSS